MTLNTWKAVALPVTAKAAARGSWLRAAKHSLHKWEHMRPEVLLEHDVGKESGAQLLSDGGARVLRIDYTNCALCQKAVAVSKHLVEYCEVCPLYKIRRGRACDESKGNGPSPWASWSIAGNPEPMIKLLRQAVESLDK